jgi:hypothetical protein
MTHNNIANTPNGILSLQPYCLTWGWLNPFWGRFAIYRERFANLRTACVAKDADPVAGTVI